MTRTFKPGDRARYTRDWPSLLRSEVGTVEPDSPNLFGSELGFVTVRWSERVNSYNFVRIDHLELALNGVQIMLELV